MCDGYERDDAKPCNIVLELVTGSTERRSVQYFWERTRHEYGAFYVRAFFQSTAPQASQTHPAILHALVALAAQHEYMETPESQWRLGEPPDTFALRHYQKAISSLAQPANQIHLTLEIVLASCLLLFFYDMMRYDHRASVIHVMAGMKLLQERKPVPGTDFDRDHAISTLTKIMESAYFTLESGGQSADVLMQYIFNKPIEIPKSTTTAFSIHEDQRLGGGLYDWMFEFIDEIVLLTAMGQNNQLQQSVKRSTYDSLWLKSHIAMIFYAMTCKGRAKPDRAFVDAARLPGMHHAVPALMFGALQMRDEMKYDGLIDQFQTIVEESRATIKTAASAARASDKSTDAKEKARSKGGHGFLSPSVNIIAPLYFTSVKCREPLIRRQAISLLRVCPPHPYGSWDTSLSADIAQAILSIEERGLGVVESPKDIPKSNRIVVEQIDHDSLGQDVRIRYRRGQYRDGSEIFEETVPCHTRHTDTTGPLSWADMPSALQQSSTGSDAMGAVDDPNFSEKYTSFESYDLAYRIPADQTLETLPNLGVDNFDAKLEDDVPSLGWSAEGVSPESMEDRESRLEDRGKTNPDDLYLRREPVLINPS